MAVKTFVNNQERKQYHIRLIYDQVIIIIYYYYSSLSYTRETIIKTLNPECTFGNKKVLLHTLIVSISLFSSFLRCCPPIHSISIPFPFLFLSSLFLCRYLSLPLCHPFIFLSVSFLCFLFLTSSWVLFLSFFFCVLVKRRHDYVLYTQKYINKHTQLN